MQLRRAGFDQLIVTGRSEYPVYLWVNDGRVELREASHMWGQTTAETEHLIRQELKDSHIQVVSIGQAGENLVRFASVIHSMGAAGRTGMGAVMGSKNLKAIAAKGMGKVAIARPEEFAEMCRRLHQSSVEGLASLNKIFHELGTPGLIDLYFGKLKGGGGAKNFQSNLFPNWQAISGATLKQQFTKAMLACPNCPIACKISYKVDSGEFAGVEGKSVEFGFMGAMGLRGGIDNLPALLKMNELFNLYGIDDMSGATMIAWATDCCERGILTDEDIDGVSLRWGNYRAAIEMTHKIAKREGFGDILAEGEKRAPKMVGRGSERFMYHVKGQAFGTEDPRASKSGGLQAHTAPRGEDHLTAISARMAPILATTEVGRELAKDSDTWNLYSHHNKGWLVKWCEDICAVVNAFGVCLRPASGVPFDVFSRMISSATGLYLGEKELLQIGERIFNVYKAFNSREGLTRKDDYCSVPDKFTREPIPDGSFQGEVLNLDMLLDEYYRVRGWDPQTGLQTKGKLQELGLDHVAEELARMGKLGPPA
ncbi:MAG: hypothetical protein HY530_02980 [Chloroflexi bacterium]|nr:hypothetical protein [Chloroflexota bacterium]